MLWKWGNYRNKRLELLHDISVAEEQIEAVLDVKAAPLTGMPNGSAVSDKVSRMAERYEEKKARLEEDIAYYREKLETETEIFELVDALVERMTITKQRVLRLRYVEGRKYQEIANILRYEKRSVEDIEARAVDILKWAIYTKKPTEE